MFRFGNKKSLQGPTFVVGSSSLFVKNQMTPTEYGREMIRLGFSFALAQVDEYRKTDDHSIEDTLLLTAVSRNPGPFQSLYVDLVSAGFLCHAKMFLGIGQLVISEIEVGILDEFRTRMTGFDESTPTTHRDITANFALAIEREIRKIDMNSSVDLLVKYLAHFYPNSELSEASAMPSALHSFILGLGSRFVGVCHDNFKISFRST